MARRTIARHGISCLKALAATGPLYR